MLNMELNLKYKLDMLCTYLVYYVKKCKPDIFERELLLNHRIDFTIEDLSDILSPYVKYIQKMDVKTIDYAEYTYGCVLHFMPDILSVELFELLLGIESWCITVGYTGDLDCLLQNYEFIDTDLTSKTIYANTWIKLFNCNYVFDTSKHKLVGDKVLTITKLSYDYLVKNRFKFKGVDRKVFEILTTSLSRTFILSCIKRHSKIAINIDSELEEDEILEKVANIAVKLSASDKARLILYHYINESYLSIRGRRYLFEIKANGVRFFTDESDYRHCLKNFEV